jgi:hypothetical protein
MRYDAASGKPVAYDDNLFGETPYDLPLQWYDAAIPDPFPDRDWGATAPWSSRPTDPYPDRTRTDPWTRRPGWGRYYEVIGDWKSGNLAWTHVQEGARPSFYAVYFDLLPDGARPSGPAPRGWIGDGAHRTARVGKHSTGLLHGCCRMADLDRDGLLDLACGSSRGGILWYPNLGTRQKPRFSWARLLFRSDGIPIDVGFLSTPVPTDWDGDGKVDLLVGANEGFVLFYRNVGTDREPVYRDEGPVQADGRDLRTPVSPVPEVEGPAGEPIYKVDYQPYPQVVDWDGDGLQDLIVGGYVTGRIYWYRNTGSDASGLPRLEARGPLAAGGKPLDVGWCASPAAADLDGDGDLDVVTGLWRKPGNEAPPPVIAESFLAYFANLGTRASPQLEMTALPRIGELPADTITSPTLADWDGDGDLDLMVTSFEFGHIYLIENIGDARRPKFDARRVTPLALPWGTDPLPFYTQNFHIYADVDHDGAIDIVAGKSFFSTGAPDVFLNANRKLPWEFKPAAPLLPPGEVIDHRAWRGDDWAHYCLVDFDGDGAADLLFGDFFGQVWFHRTRGRAGKASYDTAGVKVTLPDGTPVRAGPSAGAPWDFTVMQGSRLHVVAADFDGDGAVDLALNDTLGRNYFCRRGASHARQPVVEQQVLVADFRVRGNNTAADWDRDGKLDLLCSLGSKYYLLRNLGALRNGSPFAPPAPLDLPLVPVFGTEVSLAVMDVNRDGDPDVIAASGHNYHCFFERSFLEHGYAAGSVLGLQRRK